MQFDGIIHGVAVSVNSELDSGGNAVQAACGTRFNDLTENAVVYQFPVTEKCAVSSVPVGGSEVEYHAESQDGIRVVFPFFCDHVFNR